MNSAHLHIILVHIPVLFVPLGTLFLIFAIWKDSTMLRRAALLLFSTSAVVTICAFLLGEGAEELVEHAAGVVESAIDVHEDASELALWFTSALGLVSLALFGSELWGYGRSKSGTFLLVALSILSSVTLGYSAQLGGKIRHPEAFLADIGVPALSSAEDD